MNAATTTVVEKTAHAGIESTLAAIDTLAQSTLPPSTYDPFFLNMLNNVRNGIVGLVLELGSALDEDDFAAFSLSLEAQLNNMEELFSLDAPGALAQFQQLRENVGPAWNDFFADATGAIVDPGDDPFSFLEDFDFDAFDAAIEELVNSGQLSAQDVFEFFQESNLKINDLFALLTSGAQLGDESVQSLLENWLEIGETFADLLPPGSTARTMYDAFLADMREAIEGIEPGDDTSFLGNLGADFGAIAADLQALVSSGVIDDSNLQALFAAAQDAYLPLIEALNAGNGTIDPAVWMSTFAEFRDIFEDFVDEVLAGLPGTDGVASQLGSVVAAMQAKAAPGGVVSGTPGPDNLFGSSLAELIDALGGDDRMNGREGDDLYRGGDGLDTAIFASLRQASTVQIENGSIVAVSGPDGNDALSSVERGQFTDLMVAADTDVTAGGPGNAGTAYGLLWSVRAALPLYQDPVELGRWIARFDAGDSTETVAQSMIDHYTGGAGVATEALVAVLYQSIAGSPISPTDLAFYSQQIDSGGPAPFTSQASAFAWAATLDLAQAQYEPLITVTGIDYVPFAGA